MDIRASDDDRQRVVTALERHTGAGRLSLDEFATRVERVHGATTQSELAAVTCDLPAIEDGPRREFLLIMLVALITLALLGAYVLLR